MKTRKEPIPNYYKCLKVEIYRNLHFPEVIYSIRDCKTRRVIGYTQNLVLENAEFIVSQTGRDRVLREKRKNVHAVIRGTPIPSGGTSHSGRLITYNPYLSNQFYLKNKPECKVLRARRVIITNGRIKADGIIFMDNDQL